MIMPATPVPSGAAWVPYAFKIRRRAALTEFVSAPPAVRPGENCNQCSRGFSRAWARAGAAPARSLNDHFLTTPFPAGPDLVSAAVVRSLRMFATTEFRESLSHDWGWRSVKRALKPISPQWLLNWRERRF